MIIINITMYLCRRDKKGWKGGGDGMGWDGMGTLRIKKGTAVMTAPDAPYLAG